ncbi:hamartin isoform X2 [Chrysoperla carnea]|uniref:hamartin isoform X2 n=1 Tax=Chrysoperla carnea TaxID=189513 RepID=UPI001D071506|nr:hamartin isoform X2 [Chrysoperla carnea]
METMELFNSLESNEPNVAEQIKKRFHENFVTSKEPWLLHGLFDYFVQTNSIRSVEIIVSAAREPHVKHLYDRIDEGLRQPIKLQALTLLGHVVRRQPSWIYKITQHPLLKNLLKLLKTETEILPLMSALLILIILLPMIPANIGPYLNDIFEIFSRLAAWNRNNSGKFSEECLVHLQVGMYALFLRLYGMYPCNFLSYLRQVYGPRDHLAVFSHTIKPMLETVKMHPLLVTASKDNEITTNRWKEMGHHDVIVECAKLTLDPSERLREDAFSGLTSSFRSSRPGTEHSNTSSSYFDSIHFPIQTSSYHPSSYLSLANELDSTTFSPSVYFQYSTSPPASDISVTTSISHTPIGNSSTPQAIISHTTYAHQEGTSPPEAAVEATPETTPIKDLRLLSTKPVPPNSSVVRALTNFNPTKWGDIGLSLSQSQPSSPMKKETSSAFKFPTDSSHSAFEQPRKDIIVNESFPDHRPNSNLRSKTPLNHPTSPLRVISYDSSVPNSPVPIETTAPVPGAKDWHVAKPKPEKNGFRFESPVTQDISQEDQEVVEIVKQGEQYRNHNNDTTLMESLTLHHTNQHPNCDSVLQDFHNEPHNEDFEECEQQLGSPCTMGGLHMPNSQSMIHLVKRVNRLRFYSQCVADTSSIDYSTGSSPNDRIHIHENIKVRRANSCPEMKKSFTVLPSEPLSKVLNESDEIESSNTILVSENNNKVSSLLSPPALNGNVQEQQLAKQFNTIGIQTIETWPQPYEYLFLDLFPSVETTNTEYTQTSAGPSPAPSASHQQQQQNTVVRFSPYDMLDKYIETSKQIGEKDSRRIKNYESEIKSLREQLELVYLQVQFERHRRDVHSERNRRLMGKAKSNRAFEEYNNALRDQLALLQKEIESLKSQIESNKRESSTNEKRLQEDIDYWQKQCTLLQDENKMLKHQKENMEEAIQDQNKKIIAANTERQQTEATLLDLRNEMHFAITQAIAGEQVRADFEQLQKEHILLGELQLKYQERFADLPNLKCRDEEIEFMTEAYAQEIEALNQQLMNRNAKIEALKVRNTDLENAVQRHDEICSEQKRILTVVKEEYQEKLNAVEAKYNTQHAIIKRMEENLLELHTRIDRFEYVSRRVLRSPVSMSSDIGSGERAGGPSPHSSPPLSVSLTSSEGGGSMAFLQTGASTACDVEIKNLQDIVDQPESKTNSSILSDAEPTTSSKMTLGTSSSSNRQTDNSNIT